MCRGNLGLLLATAVLPGCTASNANEQESGKVSNPLRFIMKSLDGKDVDLSKYQGRVVLIVNVASKCGLTPQYKQMQALYDKYADDGLVILGFPCNQCLWQEPGNAEEIGSFCRVNYGVTFDMFAKVKVNGKGSCDLYKTLTAADTSPVGSGKIRWNFEKFVVGRNGEVVARFSPRTRPDDQEVVKLIEEQLAKPASGASGKHS